MGTGKVDGEGSIQLEQIHFPPLPTSYEELAEMAHPRHPYRLTEMILHIGVYHLDSCEQQNYFCPSSDQSSPEVVFYHLDVFCRLFVLDAAANEWTRWEVDEERNELAIGQFHYKSTTLSTKRRSYFARGLIVSVDVPYTPLADSEWRDARLDAFMHRLYGMELDVERKKYCMRQLSEGSWKDPIPLCNADGSLMAFSHFWENQVECVLRSS